VAPERCGPVDRTRGRTRCARCGRDLLGRSAVAPGRARVAGHHPALRRGQLLFSEGDPSNHLFVVADGRIKVLVSSSRGEELILTVLGPGDTLGELSVLDGQPRSATAQALEDVQLVALPASALSELLGRAPELAVAWARELSATVRRLTGSSADLVFLDLPRRLAKLLVDGEGDAVDLGMSQGDTASRLGVTRQSLNRALSALQRRGWVQVEGAHIVLADRDALERFAGS
jgi:CRP-like cAMP-binding protein